ncbi:MAG: hypothetical protein IKR76_07860, partial [Ruminococcus sp.]|nr:hypothetical protein [Ruminococcus sp.]
MTKAKIIKLSAVILAAAAVVFTGYKLLYKTEKEQKVSTVDASQAADELKDYTFKQHDNLTFACKPDNIIIGEVYDKVDVTILTDGITISDEE